MALHRRCEGVTLSFDAVEAAGARANAREDGKDAATGLDCSLGARWKKTMSMRQAGVALKAAIPALILVTTVPGALAGALEDAEAAFRRGNYGAAMRVSRPLAENCRVKRKGCAIRLKKRSSFPWLFDLVPNFVGPPARRSHCPCTAPMQSAIATPTPARLSTMSPLYLCW
jgi:hypothetical protein